MKNYVVKSGERFLSKINQVSAWGYAVTFGDKQQAMTFHTREEAVRMAARINSSAAVRPKANVVTVTMQESSWSHGAVTPSAPNLHGAT